MENTAEKNMAESGILPFDPIVLVQDVLKRWMIVVLAVVAVGVSTYIISDMRYEPVYQTNTTFVVSVRGSAASVYSNLKSTRSGLPEGFSVKTTGEVRTEEPGVYPVGYTVAYTIPHETNPELDQRIVAYSKLIVVVEG